MKAVNVELSWQNLHPMTVATWFTEQSYPEPCAVEDEGVIVTVIAEKRFGKTRHSDSPASTFLCRFRVAAGS